MTVENLQMWTFTPALFDGCEIQCPACRHWSSHHEWGSVPGQGGENGARPAITCPRCAARFDHVGAPAFAVRAPQ